MRLGVSGRTKKVDEVGSGGLGDVGNAMSSSESKWHDRRGDIRRGEERMELLDMVRYSCYSSPAHLSHRRPTSIECATKHSHALRG